MQPIAPFIILSALPALLQNDTYSDRFYLGDYDYDNATIKSTFNMVIEHLSQQLGAPSYRGAYNEAPALPSTTIRNRGCYQIAWWQTGGKYLTAFLSTHDAGSIIDLHLESGPL